MTPMLQRLRRWATISVMLRSKKLTQAMEADFSFDRCARTYAELYKTL